MNPAQSIPTGLPAGANLPGPARPGIHWPSAFQFGLSVLAAFLSFSSAIGLVGYGFIQLLNPSGLAQQDLTIFVGAASAFATAVLTLPSAWFSLQRLISRPVTSPAWLRWLSNNPLPLAAAVVLLGLSLLVGNFAANNPRLALLLLPPLQILAVGLPLYVYSTLVRWKISAGTPQRNWGIFATGLVLGPLVIIALELLAIVIFAVLAILYVSLQPNLMQELAALGERISAAGNSPDAILRLLEPYLLSPLVILALLLFISGIVPLIEELLKPIGAWFVAGSGLTAAQGFAAGLISGTGYALFENLALSNTGTDWTITLIGRIGTGILHVTTAGLTGWALITAVNERRYLRLGLVYLVSVLIHGTWNALALLSAVSQLDLPGSAALSSSLKDFAVVSRWAYVGMVVLVLLLASGALLMNHSLRSKDNTA